MNKNTKKVQSRDWKKALAVKYVAAQFGCTTAYVYGLMNGNNPIGGAGEDILKAYREKYAELEKIIF